MATYKVIQDIEAEDKLVGPLSLKQFIYACIAAIAGYLSFLSTTHGVAFFLIVTFPVFIFMGFFAFPWGRDQPTEIWALAKIRYFLKPRQRIWDQSGMKELVNVTAPKHIERELTNNLTETQVQSRLTALATTLDSRGWAIKNADLNLKPVDSSYVPTDSDRLVAPSSMLQAVSPVDITAGDDIMDERNNPRAQQLDQMINDSSKSHRTRLIDRLRMPPKPTTPGFPRGKTGAQLPTPAENWYANQPSAASPLPAQPPTAPAFTFTQSIPAPTIAALAPAAPLPQQSPQMPSIPQAPSFSTGMPPALADTPTADEEAFMEELRRQQEQAEQVNTYPHMKTVQPLDDQTQQSSPGGPAMPGLPGMPPPATQTMTPHSNPATIGLSTRDDLTISTIANIASGKDEHPDEVVISLHNRSS